MIPSRLILTPETRAKLSNPVLSAVKKRQLREEMIKDSIRSAVGGMRTKQELIVAAGYSPDAKTNDYAKGHTLIGSMLRRGIISHNKTNAFKKIWTVHEDVRVTPSPKQVAAAIVVKEPVVALKEQEELDKVKLVDMAKEFAWRENSDSLREFIAYMEKAVK